MIRRFGSHPDKHEGEVAAVITEAVLMNVGIILPDEGYLQSVRDITRRHGVLLIFDEVKTGVTVAPGGITELYPVEPDLICLANLLVVVCQLGRLVDVRKSCAGSTTVRYCTWALLMAILCRCVQDW